MAEEPENNPAPEAAAPPAGVKTVDLSAVDRALDAIDPGFNLSLKDVAELKPTEDKIAAVDDSDIEKALEVERRAKNSKGWRGVIYRVLRGPYRRLRRLATFVWVVTKPRLLAIGPWVKKTGLAAIHWLKTSGLAYAKAGLAWLQGRVNAFLKLRGIEKLAIVGGVCMLALVAFVGNYMLKGPPLPTMKMNYLRSFADVADERFEFKDDEHWEDFDNPVLHPEHMLLIERVIANLKSPGDGHNPMVLMDFYVECASTEAAVEVRDREVEIRDLVTRSLEQMEYEHLTTQQGKTQLKIYLRKAINDFLTKGRVRKVLFKNLILKP